MFGVVSGGECGVSWILLKCPSDLTLNLAMVLILESLNNLISQTPKSKAQDFFACFSRINKCKALGTPFRRGVKPKKKVKEIFQ